MLLNWWSRWRGTPEPEPQQPDEAQLKRWARSEWIEYQAWLFEHGFVSLHDWHSQQQAITDWTQPLPTISLVTPVYNTDPEFLNECIDSVQAQSYPLWELCLVDDGSSREDTLATATERAEADARIRYHRQAQNQGICPTTNQAIQLASGEFIGFLDHDDRLAPDALFRVVEALQQQPDADILYSDRDMLSLRNTRFMHLFKPDWSPETLLSGNYLFHLLVYRRSLIEQLGGVRVEFEGSQDYDLILRACERSQRIVHIPHVLYHWRQHENSVALAHDSKAYAYQAGMRALSEALARRGIRAEVSENPALWRGNYRLQFPPTAASEFTLLRWQDSNTCSAEIRAQLADIQTPYVLILGADTEALDAQALDELLGWLQIPEVALVTGKVINAKQHLLHAGMVQRDNGTPLSLYAGHPESNPGYMAVTAMARNVSAVSPNCIALRRDTAQQLSADYQGAHGWQDLALQALSNGQRIVYSPHARFACSAYQMPEQWPEHERQAFATQWADWLAQGDPNYNRHLNLKINDMGLNILDWLAEYPDES